MPLITTSVPNLIQGVSQQPDAVRFAGQGDEQENALSSVVDGLKKRPNTRHVAQLLTTAISNNSFTHFIDRDSNEKYVIIHDGTHLRAFNILTGEPCTINGSDSAAISTTDYLRCTDPIHDINALTISDVTFLNNKKKKVTERLEKSPPNPKEAIAFVALGDYDTNYRMELRTEAIDVDSTSRGRPVRFNTPNLVHIPGTKPPEYRLDSRQFNAPPGSTTGGIPAVYENKGNGYHKGNKEVTVSSNSKIITAPQFDTILGTETESDRVTRISLLGSGRFAPVTGTSQTANLSYTHVYRVYPLALGHQGNNRYSYSIRGTVTLDSSSLAAYIGAGSPIMDLSAHTSGPHVVEWKNQTGSRKNSSFFRNVRFKAGNGKYEYQTTYSGNYSGYWHNSAWWNWARTSGGGNGSETESGSFSMETTTYLPPTVSLSMETPRSSNIVAIARSITTAGANATDARYKINTNKIAESLTTALNAINTSGGYTLTQDENLIVARPAQPTLVDFYASVSDGLSNNALILLYEATGSVSDLPVYCKNGFKIKIEGDADLSQDDYYVEFKTNNGTAFGNGVWVETVGFDTKLGFAPDTAPHGLINTGPNRFVYGPFDGAKRHGYAFNKWGDRTVGDDDSNPLPSFIGQTINELTFYKDRLGFITSRDAVFSEAGEFFNFTRLTVRSLLDSAPIDVSVSSPEVSSIKAAIPFQNELILFGDTSQYKLSGGDILTPSTVSVSPLTRFSFDSRVRPLSLGSYIYFPFKRGSYSGLREYNINETTDTYDSVEVTEHVPAYIPRNIIDIAGTSSEDMIVLLSGEERNTLYVYTFFWNNNRKVLSSWSKFTFRDDIRGIEFIDSLLYMVTVDDQSNTHLVELPIEANAAEVDHNGNAAPFRTLVDKRVRARLTGNSNLISFEKSDGSYSSSRSNYPYTFHDTTSGTYALTEVFVDSDGNTYALKQENGRVKLAGGRASATIHGYVGLPYTMKYRFSTQIFKASGGNSASPTASTDMTVRSGTLFFDDTHTFDVKVTPSGRPEATTTFSADDRPEAETPGGLKFAEGDFSFPVHSKAKHAKIVLENASPFESRFSSAEFESFVHPRSRRYG